MQLAPNDVVDSAVAAFSQNRPCYKKLAAYVRSLIQNHCGSGSIHTTERRTKTVVSFEKKCRKLNDDGSFRYPRPNEQITDLAGVRVIVFIRDDVDPICTEISKLFEVFETEDVGERVYRAGKFGYQSKHLLIKLGSDRKDLIENKEILDLVCEVQVRTILQHAWAAMEHDIQYKSTIDIPLDLNRRFSALAGLLEIADREFANIQHDSELLKRTVKEDLLSDLTKQGLDQNQLRGGPAENLALDARNLVSKGRYTEALQIYTDKIETEPTSYTLYIGRARSKFLAGDARGALADLDQADQLSGDASKTARLKQMMQMGDDPRLPRALQTAPRFEGGVHSTSEAIKAGKGVDAFKGYSDLETQGYNWAFAQIGKAMACTLERDIEGARSFLKALQIRPGTLMAANIYALSCIFDILESKDFEENFSNLSRAMIDVPQYALNLSPLQDLLIGLRVKQFAEQGELEKVFAKLQHGEPS